MCIYLALAVLLVPRGEPCRFHAVDGILATAYNTS